MHGEDFNYGVDSQQKELIKMRLLLIVIFLALLISPASAWTPRNKTDANYTHAPLNTTWMTNLTQSIAFNTSGFVLFFGALTLPYTTSPIGRGFYIFVYVLPLAVIWVRQEKAIIPVGLSIIFGALLLSQLPEAWQLPAELFMIITVVGLLYSMFKERG